MKSLEQKIRTQLKEVVEECYRNFSERGWSTEQWAAKAGVHPNTILRIADERTTYPRYQTIARMAHAVGLDLAVVASYTQHQRRSA